MNSETESGLKRPFSIVNFSLVSVMTSFFELFLKTTYKAVPTIKISNPAKGRIIGAP